ncbi:MAG: UDP-N-acetylmuramate dehydrogenase [Clostridia bacterium]|nr:UDP-N-acetylmuramate dehydrogenase [Clostridia bacterium]
MELINAAEEFLHAKGIPARTDMTGAECTTFRTGGRIALFAEPRDAESAAAILGFAREEGIPHFIIGNGSNLLVPDEGLDMLFIRLAGGLCSFEVRGDELFAGAGASFAAAAKHSVAKGLMGLEWAAGIPGTVGGAAAMNAGAYGGEVKDVLKRLTVLRRGEAEEITPAEGSMGYRRSEFSFPGCTVLSAVFGLAQDDGGAKERMDGFSARRREKQPLNYPSAGSTFKRPEGYFAGKLIEDAGLKGFRIGGAAVSEKHAGFVVNLGGATSADVLAVIEAVRETVYKKFGVMLEPEVRILRQEAI